MVTHRSPPPPSCSPLNTSSKDTVHITPPLTSSFIFIHGSSFSSCRRRLTIRANWLGREDGTHIPMLLFDVNESVRLAAGSFVREDCFVGEDQKGLLTNINFIPTTIATLPSIFVCS